MTDEEIEKLARRIVALQAVTNEILTRSEAMTYDKRNSPAPFCRWCKTWSVRPAFRGRYSRSQLDLALSREARRRG